MSPLSINALRVRDSAADPVYVELMKSVVSSQHAARRPPQDRNG